MINPLKNHYAIENPASIYDEEAMTALELAGRTTAKVNEVVEAQNALDERVSDTLALQDEKLDTFQNETIPETVAGAVNEHIASGEFAEDIDRYAGNLTSRLDNLVGSVKQGSTTLDAEVIDGRVDKDGYIFPNLGTAMRWQDETLRTALNYANVGYNRVLPHWEQGSFNAANPVENATNAQAVRSAETPGIPAKKIHLIIGGAYTLKLYEYSYSNGVYTWLADQGWKTGEMDYTFHANTTHYRPVIKRADGGAIAVDEAKNVLLLYRTSIYDYFERKTEKLPGLIASTTIAKTAYDNETFTGGWNLANTRRWFMGTPIPANSYLEKIGVYCNEARDSLKVGVWRKDGNHLFRLMEIDTPVQKGVNYITLDVYDSYPMLLSFYAPVATVSWNNADTTGSFIYGDSSVDTPNAWVPNLTLVENARVAVTAYYNAYTFATKPYVYEVGPGRAYEEIQDALDASVNDSRPVILVYPRSTPYKRFSTIRAIGAPYPWEAVKVRNLDIIGMSRTNCVVQDDTGEYDSPPAEIAINGEVRNLSFVATNQKPLTNPVKGGYACHIDGRIENNSGYKMTFRNCHFKSATGPAVGVGLQEKAWLHFDGCEFVSHAEPSYKPNDSYGNLADYGALYCHTATIPASGQSLSLHNCHFYSYFGNRGIWLSAVGDYTPFTVVARFNTIEVLKSSAKRVVMDESLILDGSSFGNNSSRINADVIKE